MTTQNMQPENHDVDTFVVEQPFVSETNSHPQELLPTEAAQEASEVIPVAPQMPESQSAATQAQGTTAPDEPVGAQFIAPPESTLPQPTASVGAQFIALTKDPVRPFTAYIEEFRQAELQQNVGSQGATGEFFPSLTQENTATFLPAPESAPSLTIEEAATRAPAELAASSVAAETTPSLPAPSQESEQTVAQAQAQSANSTDSTAEQVPPLPQLPAAPVVRPVSPLLRPPTPRARMPRHTNRHKEQPAAGETMLSVQTNTPVAPPTKLEETTPSEAPVAPTTEPSKPARRYRFDRPSVANTPAGSLSAPSAPTQQTEENNEALSHASTLAPSLARSDNGQGSTANGQALMLEREADAVQQSKSAAGGPSHPATEPTAPKHSAIQESAPTSGGVATPPSPAVTSPSSTATHNRHRRPGQGRRFGKEQVVVTPAPVAPIAEAVPPPAEHVVAPDADIAPEDLPPLEYSELQAASSRRRRRRRSGSVTTGIAIAAPTPLLPPVAKTATPEPLLPAASIPSMMPVPVSAPTSVAAPRNVATPGVPAPVPASQYNIVSGYTVNQMNQGNDAAGPFMGPEPSPARGSGLVQGVRSIRNEAQRMPSYPARTGEAGPSAGSMHQFANIVSQAIQSQTDRMVAELRRANQGPTSVSVTLPPFPSTERVGVFVDVANLLYSARTQRLTLDFGKLLDFLRGNRRLVRAHAYCPTSPQPGDEQMFLQAVKGLGYRITTKNYKTFSSGAKKADMDLDLCMDVVRLVDGRSVDCIVLVSGDGDFIPMLDYCSDHGVRVEVAAFDEAMSASLRQSCDLFINLSMLGEIRA